MDELAGVTLPLFVYGSLRDPRVRARLLGPNNGITTVPAALTGHAREMVPSFGYPFLVPAPDQPSTQVDGELLLSLTERHLAVLDDYEDLDSGLYVRQRVTVQTEDGPTESWAYLRGPNAPEE